MDFCSDISNLNEDEKVLLENGIIVDNSKNEYFDIIKQFQKNLVEDKLKIILMTTEDCNFRCSYCYQNKIHRKIEKNIYDDLLKIISDNRKLRCVNVSWFGGEPLLEVNNIKYFMQNLKNIQSTRHLDINYDMTTNGYLLTLDTLKEFIDFKLDTFFITIDGLPEIHNKYRHLANGNGTYSKILENLVKMKYTDYRFKIVVRINFDAISSYEQFIDELSLLFNNDSRYSFYFRPISNWDNHIRDYVCNEEESYKKIIYLEKYAIEKELLMYSNELDELFEDQLCYAGLPNSFIIFPDGSLKKCTIAMEDPINNIGLVANHKFILDEQLHNKWINSIDIECESCEILPQCFGKKCPYERLKNKKEIHCKERSIKRINEIIVKQYGDYNE